MSESASETPAEAGTPVTAVAEAAPVAPVPMAGAPAGVGVLGVRAVAARRRGDFIYYGLRNKKLIFGLSLELLLVLGALFGPLIAKYSPTAFAGPSLAKPSAHFWLGTDDLGRDIFSQLVNGMRESYLIGVLGAGTAAIVGMALGFTAGWRGGFLDEVIQLFTNILVMIPQLVLLIVIASYLNHPGILFEGVFIGLTTWPWVARAVRAQTFSLRSREFVDMAKLSGKRPVSIIVRDIAPNMASYLFLVIILLFGSTMLVAASFDFLGIFPGVTSLGTMMFNAQTEAAPIYHDWSWFVPPGLVLTAMVAALLVANVGLDEVFNPKLREQ